MWITNSAEADVFLVRFTVAGEGPCHRLRPNL